ncbi:MAG: hypothetical protein V3W37_05355 [Candidatus Binatia bacterium]
MSKETLTPIDNRTGRSYEIPIQHGTIRAMDLRQIKISEGVLPFDLRLAIMNTSSCQSKVTLRSTFHQALI